MSISETPSGARLRLACRLVSAILGAGGIGLAPPAHSAEPESPNAPAAGVAPAVDVPQPPAPSEAVAGPHGFAFRSADGRNSLAIHALVQAAYETYFDPAPPGVASRDGFLLEFAGLRLDATLAENVGATLLVDFSQNRLTLINAYAELRLRPEFTLRAGKFAAPINEERLTPKIELPWISVSPASFLLPVDETGLEIFGSFIGVVDYSAGLVNGSTAGPPTEEDSDTFKDLMGRLYVHPFKPLGIAPLADIGLGFGGSFGRHAGTPGNPQTPTLLSYGGTPFFRYRNDGTPAGTVVANGDVSRVVPHLTWSWGPLAAYADYVHEIDTFGPASVNSDSWGATGIVALSGEDAHPFQRISVARPFDLNQNQWGALEVVFGGGGVTIGDSAFTNGLAAAGSVNRMWVVGAGLHWYPIEGLGLISDYSHTEYSAYSGAARPNEDALYAQLEFRL